MRWMNGNGEWGNGQGLANQLNNDANTNLTIRAIDGNRDALRELATNLNCDFNTLNSAICGIKGAIDKVGCDVGFSAERVINAIQMGDSNIISKMQDCCCTTQRSIDAVNLNLTKMSYEDQLAVQAQTNQLMTAINNGFCNVGQQIGNQTVAMQAGFQGIKDLFTQQKIDTLQNLNLQYSNQLSQLALTAGNPIDPPLKPGEFRNPNIPVEKIMSIRVEVFGNVLEYTVPANATSVKDGDTEIYLRRDDLETKLKSQVDSYRIMFESVNKQKQLYEKYNDLFQSVKGNSQENVTEEKYKELIARIAELEEQLKEKEQPKE